ncbi:MAG TPA: hypothetical protein VJ583_05675 [Nitrososphaeraceae archaeon]|nr:hypothetical protein [Nitrososphaeraceae archaeon]
MEIIYLSNLISEEFMGIPENADTLKREIAKAILELDDNFGSIILLLQKEILSWRTIFSTKAITKVKLCR